MISPMTFFSLLWGMLVYQVEISKAFIETALYLQFSLIRFSIILLLLCIGQLFSTHEK